MKNSLDRLLPAGYLVRRSGRRTLALEITPGAELLVRAPYSVSSDEIRRFVASHEDWIRKHLLLMEEKKKALEAGRSGQPVQRITEEQLRDLADQALREFPPRVKYFAGIIGVSYGRITIRNQRTRWGSCSSKGNLNFNCLLMLAPSEVRDYVIVHELCHRLEMNHSPRFWALVESVLPDYRSRKSWLRSNGRLLIEQMTGR